MSNIKYALAKILVELVDLDFNDLKELYLNKTIKGQLISNSTSESYKDSLFIELNSLKKYCEKNNISQSLDDLSKNFPQHRLNP